MAKSSQTHSRHLVTINQAAEYLGVTPLTVRRFVSRGQLTAYRLGSKIIRVDLNQVDDLLRPIPTTRGGLDG